MKDFSDINEWELSARHQRALKHEDYETCAAIKKEIEKRIKDDTIDHELMQGFKYWNPSKKEFEGKPMYDNLNGLFDSYKDDPTRTKGHSRRA